MPADPFPSAGLQSGVLEKVERVDESCQPVSTASPTNVAFSLHFVSDVEVAEQLLGTIETLTHAVVQLLHGFSSGRGFGTWMDVKGRTLLLRNAQQHHSVTSVR